MRQRTAETIANIVLGAAALGAAVVVLRTPALRRLAWTLAAAAVTRHAPAWLGHEIRTAWAESATHPRVTRAGAPTRT